MRIPNRLFGFCFIAAVTAAAAADPGTGQLLVRGTVAARCEVAVVDYGVNLDLVNGESNRGVARVNETCNDPDGYSIKFSSAAGGQMVGPMGAASPYRMRYQGMADATQSITRPSPQWNARYELSISVDGRRDLPAGSYSDTLTVTIAAN